MKRLARKSALSLRLRENNLLVVDDFSFDEIKTKNFAQVLGNLNLDFETTLILLPDINTNLYLSARNIRSVAIHPADKISTYDILSHKKLLIFKGAIEPLAKTFSN